MSAAGKITAILIVIFLIVGVAVGYFASSLTVPATTITKTETKIITSLVTVTPITSPSITTPITPTTTTPVLTAPKAHAIRWGTNEPGARGYMLAGFMADILRKYGYDITVCPYGGVAVSMKAFVVGGETEVCYINGILMDQLYKGVGEWEGLTIKKKPVHMFWTQYVALSLVIRADLKDKITKWADLEGQPVFLQPLGFGTHVFIEKALETVGVKANHVEIATEMVGDALREGRIVAVCFSIAGGISPQPWNKQAELAVDLAPLNPSPEEMNKLKEAGFTIMEVNVEKAFVRNKGMGKLYGVCDYYGWGTTVEDLTEDEVYIMLKILEKHKDEFVGLDPGLKALAEDFAGFQVSAIRSLPDIPIHPGLAKFLKEKGLWDPKWIVAK